MKRRDLEKALLILETTPFVYERVVLGGDPALRQKIADLLWEAVAIEEHVWSARIRLLTGEASSVLPRLDREGALRIAASKSGARAAVASFLRLRRQNARFIRGISASTVGRTLPLEGGGTFSVGDLPGAMAEEDQRSLRELARRIVAPATRECCEPVLATV